MRYYVSVSCMFEPLSFDIEEKYLIGVIFEKINKYVNDFKNFFSKGYVIDVFVRKEEEENYVKLKLQLIGKDGRLYCKMLSVETVYKMDKFKRDKNGIRMYDKLLPDIGNKIISLTKEIIPGADVVINGRYINIISDTIEFSFWIKGDHDITVHTDDLVKIIDNVRNLDLEQMIEVSDKIKNIILLASGIKKILES